MTDDQSQRSWASMPTVDELNALGKGFLFDALGMRIEEASAERVVMSMPVTQMTQQPVGILHGGATVALAESAASIGTWLGIDRTAFSTVGLEINCNHLRAKRDGTVRAIATPVHRGRRNWVWDIRVYDEADALIAISRCTLAVVPIG
ncbi:MAG TPA: hotdog fold thioesterase [Ktedonobacterales bacterium]